MDVVVASALPAPELGGESGRSSPSPTASPEFEFWMVGRNPGSFPSPALLTADELFSGGIVLPLHTLQAAPSPDAHADQAEDAEPDDVKESSDTELPEEEGGPATQPLAEACAIPTPDLPAVTFKWKDIFKATGESKERAKKSERRASSSVSGNAELININIWPFSRSRSAGHSAAPGAGAIGKAKASSPSTGSAGAAAASAPTAAATATAAGRKVSSAPCSRSNSRGETSGPSAPAVALAAAAEKAAAAQGPATSMLRRLVPGGQGRTGLGVNGIRLGRASPVWQLRRNKLQQQQVAAEQKQNSNAAASAKGKAVPENDAATSQPDAGEQDKAATAATTSAAEETASVSAPTAVCRNNAAVCSEVVGEECNPPQGLFGLRRTFFSKKVY